MSSKSPGIPFRIGRLPIVIGKLGPIEFMVIEGKRDILCLMSPRLFMFIKLIVGIMVSLLTGLFIFIEMIDLDLISFLAPNSLILGIFGPYSMLSLFSLEKQVNSSH